MGKIFRLVIVLFIIQHADAKKVYMNSLSDCFLKTPIEVEEPVMISHQDNNPYDMLVCNITLKTVPGEKLCLSFQHWVVTNCAVYLHLQSGTETRSYDCFVRGKPETFCSGNELLTVILEKKLLSQIGYEFSLLVESSKGDTYIHFKNGHNDAEMGREIGDTLSIVSLTISSATMLFVLVVLLLLCCRRQTVYKRTSRQQQTFLKFEDIPKFENCYSGR
ncbi:uncharacterized protein LOC128216975 [Mya arenaria]|uniref:uncharacterized protein LOC128216975 n=1 Tax=Mya arenaria TaxID=6604 RepID=UPI0022E6C485|nr:uncharacterized protein LOC128216975 [Mya arenaria]